MTGKSTTTLGFKGELIVRYWHYTGDKDLREGGTFYALDTFKDGYCDAVRITHCSDAGGQSNAWCVEALTVIIPDRDDDRFMRAFESMGVDIARLTEITRATREHATFCVMNAYGLYDPDDFPQVVQIGAVPDIHHLGDAEEPTVTLRGNASLRRWVRAFIRSRFS